MRNFRYILMVFALLIAFTLTVCADDDWYIGDWDDFEDTTTTSVETTTEEVTTEPESEPSTEEVTTEPETETSTEEVTTEPSASERGEETTEPDASASEEVTTEPDASVSEEVTTEPDASGTDAPVTTRPAESETEDDEETPWMLPIPVIFITIGVVGVGGIVVLVILLRMYFRAQQDEENK